MIAIENLRRFNCGPDPELTRTVEGAEGLREVGQAVSSTLDLQTVLTSIVSHAVQLSGIDAAAIYEYTNPRKNFTLGPAIEWNRSWSRRFGQTQSVWVTALADARSPPELQSKSLTSWMSGKLEPRESGLSRLGSVIVPSLPSHSFVRIALSADFRSIVGRRGSSQRKP